MRFPRLAVSSLKKKFKDRVERERLRLASAQAALPLAFLGVMAGVLSGLVIIAFRYAIEFLQGLYMPYGDIGRFEDLSLPVRFALPVMGALVLAAICVFVPPAARRIGVVHVMERMQYHEGHLPLRNFLYQFFGGIIALASGQSGGREAPSVHLGAGISSLFGRAWQLPNNAVRTLVACGTAAAIAASFNTPLAGVVFAMEVVVMEYTIAGFTPVILAAVSATACSRIAFGSGVSFMVPQMGLQTQWELFYITFMGITIGAASAGFVKALRTCGRRAKELPAGVPVLIAGGLTAVVGLACPEVLGLGYDTVNKAVLGDIALYLLPIIFFAKLAVTAVSVGAGIPAGVIGPCLVMGAMIGGLFAVGSDHLGTITSSNGLYVILGMGAMMSACLQAPLAALVTVMELTANPHIIFPAMLAIVSANLMAREVFKQESVFILMMRDAGLDYRYDFLEQGLRRIGVAAVMDRRIALSPPVVPVADARKLLADGPRWIVIQQAKGKEALLPAADLARVLESLPAEQEEMDLLGIPGQRLELSSVHLQATMQEARVIFERTGAGALCVRRVIAPLTERTFGVLTRSALQKSYSTPG